MKREDEEVLSEDGSNEKMVGNIFVRSFRRKFPNGVPKGAIIGSHRHHFDHPKVVFAGGFEISLWKDVDLDAFGMPGRLEREYSVEVWAGDDEPWHLILKGRLHSSQSLQDGSKYACFYSHMFPQSHSVDMPGQQNQLPYTRRDPDGSLWHRVNETIVQEASGLPLEWRKKLYG